MWTGYVLAFSSPLPYIGIPYLLLCSQPSKQQQRRRSFRLLRRQSKPQPPSQFFSCELCVHSASERAQCQELVTTGSKAWGIGPALPLAKLYDFAIYLNRGQTEQSSLASQFRQQPAAAPRLDALYHSLRSSSDIDFSLVVRAARNLPIKLVAAEYRRILRGRLVALGHDPGDPRLAAMLEAFRCAVHPVHASHQLTLVLLTSLHGLVAPLRARRGRKRLQLIRMDCWC